MSSTVVVNGLSVCHKGSKGVTIATLPDVCKTPTPGGPIPLPYTNIAFSKDLAKGSTSVKADGESIAIRGSEFSMSIGDDPGTAGGVISGVNKSKATWLLFSPNVKVQKKNACRLTDKMLMNKGNTISIGGELQPPKIPPVTGMDQTVKDLCEAACKCKKAKRKQNCMSRQIRKSKKNGGMGQYKGNYPKKDATVWTEVVMEKGANGGKGWDYVKASSDNAPKGRSVPTSLPFGKKGCIRPDIVITDGNGKPTRMIEVKFPGDTLNENQRDGGKYDKAVKDLKKKYGSDFRYDSMEVEEVCDFCWN